MTAMVYTPKVKELDGLRYYNVNGVWMPSVTSILSASSAPIPYSKRSRISTSGAMARGTELHRLCERWLHGHEETAIAPEVEPYWASILPALQQVTGPVLTERFVVNRTETYAGSFDLLGEFRGAQNVLIDYKTSRDPSRLTKGQLHRYGLQLGAYAAAIGDSMQIEVSRGVLIIVHPEGVAHELPIERPALDSLGAEFVAIRRSLGEKLESRQAKRSAIVSAFSNWS
jgi:CRISPR/Cas system-associated exonuclease Cas4 (RecB family)